MSCHCEQCERDRRARKRKKKKSLEFSKKLILDIRWLLWMVTGGGLLLAALCIYTGYTGGLPWVTAMVGLPWTAHGTVCSFYMKMCQSDHSVGGITFEAAKAVGFKHSEERENGSVESPSI